MIRAVIIDDEPMARKTLAGMLKRYFPEQVEVVGEADGAKSGAIVIHKHHPDLVFLDIEMPDENGFRLFDYFHKIEFQVIFTTAYKNYAIEAIKVAALDYILKPINFIDLRDAIERFKTKENDKSPHQKIEELLHNIHPVEDRYGKIPIPTFDGYSLEKINHILYCEADQNYTRVYTLRGETLMVSRSLGFLEEQLPKDIFFRIHKSYLVNLNFVKTYSRKDGNHIVLENGTNLSIASRRNEAFLQVLTNRV
jgi:two-component system LytT family response regulator